MQEATKSIDVRIRLSRIVQEIAKSIDVRITLSRTGQNKYKGKGRRPDSV